MNSGTPADFSKPIAEGEDFSASITGRIQATEVVAEKQTSFSKPGRTGGAGSGVESAEEDSERQHPVPPQPQQLQIAACAFAVGAGAGPGKATCAQASTRLNSMASDFFTQES